MDRGTARALSRGERPDRGRGARGGSVPYRRLVVLGAGRARAARGGGIRGRRQRVRRRPRAHAGGGALPVERDRKSTRLNSSHLVISYAVFCLKKKNTVNRDGLCVHEATVHLMHSL